MGGGGGWKREEEEEEQGGVGEEKKKRVTQCVRSVTHHIGWQIPLRDPIKGLQNQNKQSCRRKKKRILSHQCSMTAVNIKKEEEKEEEEEEEEG